MIIVDYPDSLQIIWYEWPGTTFMLYIIIKPTRKSSPYRTYSPFNNNYVYALLFAPVLKK